jgi:lipid II:glycine glycyltransferase (peptidoglycan interpeptide bridge formation enzyme)
MPFMEVNSWLTGKRGVCLPFTDHCTPIVTDNAGFQEMVQYVFAYGEKAHWRCVEFRDAQYFGGEADPAGIYFTHDLDLKKTETELFSNLRDSTKRNIKKALKDGVTATIERSPESLDAFYRLSCITHKRHGVPPQPFSFFNKVFEHIIAKGNGVVASAVHSGKVIASSIFFHLGKNAIFKYGASDLAHHDLRPNNLVMWQAIKCFREKGFETFNFGRTETENLGLLQYKRGWGARESLLEYCRYDLKRKAFVTEVNPMHGLAKRVFALSPVAMLRLVGSLLYKHVG